MSGGSLSLPSSNFSDEDEKDDKSAESNFVDAREVPEGKIPINQSSITTGSRLDLAKEEETGLKYHLSTVKAEQRVKFLGNLAYLGVGTNRVEKNQLRSRNELRYDTGRKVGDIVAEMELKKSDAKKEAGFERHQRNVWKRRLEERDDLSTGQVKKMLRRIHKRTEETKKEIEVKHAKAESFKVRKWSNNLLEPKSKNCPELRGFEAISVINGPYRGEVS